MGSVASNSNGLSDLLHTLSHENSPLLSTLSSPAVQKALENAPAGDIAQLSEQAQQLQSIEVLFGNSNTSSASSNSLFSALASIGSSANASASGSALNPGASLADQLAAYQGNMQTQETQALFGITPSTIAPGSQLNLFG